MSAAEDRFMRDAETIGLGKAYPEYRFDAKRRWRFDYAFRAKIAIEIDGGAHSHPAKRAKDAAKRNAAATDGWLVLVFTPQQIRDGSWMDGATDAVVWRATWPETVIDDRLDGESDYEDAELHARQLSDDETPF